MQVNAVEVLPGPSTAVSESDSDELDEDAAGAAALAVVVLGTAAVAAVAAVASCMPLILSVVIGSSTVMNMAAASGEARYSVNLWTFGGGAS